MSFLTELRTRSKKGPGGVEVFVGDNEKPIFVPLKYPKAAAQAEVMQFIKSLDDKKDENDIAAIEQNEKLTNLIVKLCIDIDEDIEDEDINVLVRESGGYNGVLARRCTHLMGFGEVDDGEGKARVAKGKRRGR